MAGTAGRCAGAASLKAPARQHETAAALHLPAARSHRPALAGKPFNPELLLEPEGLSHRSYTGGLMERRPAQDYQNYITGHSESQRSQFVGEVLQVREDGWAQVETKNRFAVGDRLEVIHPSGNRVVELSAMQNQDGESITVAQGSPIKVWVPLAAPSEGALIARLIV